MNVGHAFFYEPFKRESQKFLGKHFTMRLYMQNVWEKWDVQRCKTNFFQWHSGNKVKFATPAEFEYQIPSETWNSEFCYFSERFLAIPL